MPSFPILLLATILLAACASRREESAFDAMHAAGRLHHYADEVDADRGERHDLPELTADSPVEHYLRYAAFENPGLEAAFHRWKAALWRVPQVRALPDPRFSYGYFIEEVETRVGPQEQKFGLAQTFPWFEKLELRSDVALQEAEAARARFESVRRRLFFDVKDAYYGYRYLGRAITLTRENIALVRRLEQVARVRYRNDRASHADVIRAQVELGVLEDRLRSLEDGRVPAAARLNAVLNRAPDAPLPLPTAAETWMPPRFDQADLTTKLQKRNPDLLALDAVAAREGHAAELAGKDFYPDVTLGIEYIDTGHARVHGVDGSGDDPVVAMLSLNLPIWFGKYRAARREAELRRSAALKERRNQENRLMAALKRAAFSLRDAERKAALYESSLIPKAEQSLRVMQQAFANGKVGFLDLIDAERTLLRFRLDLERVVAERPRRLAEVEMLVGEDLPPASLELETQPAPETPS